MSKITLSSAYRDLKCLNVKTRKRALKLVKEAKRKKNH
ncbi:putative metal homeostasis protein [Aerococcaceae bacterium INB8]|uniref:Putative metal homeostasis protein n=1 Tax=Ruoffia halotolerans TaxID=2748684 RepID=A0A839A4Y3_9LACT|nr:putative metal homeostasis protein [Ruoffia halotolerans]MBA5728904.1 putative metal homeostasis protein [Ruoffia halotolerans]